MLELISLKSDPKINFIHLMSHPLNDCKSIIIVALFVCINISIYTM